MRCETLIQEVEKMTAVEAEKRNLTGAKIVTIRRNRTCIECKKTIDSGSKAVTASHMEDKKYAITLKELITHDFVDDNHFSFVPVRHWMCTCCAEKLLAEHKKMRETKVPRQRTIVSKKKTHLERLYDSGEITAKEWDDLEMADIHNYAFRQAVGLGQE